MTSQDGIGLIDFPGSGNRSLRLGVRSSQRARAKAKPPDLMAEVPGIDLERDVVRHRPSLTRVLHDVEGLADTSRPDVPDCTRNRVHDLRCIVERLFLAEDELWRARGPKLPWDVARWGHHAAAFLSACQRASTYATEALDADDGEAAAAVKSGIDYAAEAALSLCRFDLEALRLDEALAKQIEEEQGWCDSPDDLSAPSGS